MISEISLPSFGRDQIVGLLLLTIVPIGTLSLLPSCYGQTPTEPTSTIHVQSQLVLLDVVVTDSKGNVVTNLNRDDFSVYENGVAQEIRNFEPLRADDVIPTKPTKDTSGNDNWRNAPLTIFVVDQLNTPFEESAYARQQVERFLKVQ